MDYTTIGGGFWDVFNSITSPMGLSTYIANVETFRTTQLSTAIDEFNKYLDKVYYFIPENTLMILLGVVTAVIAIRIIMSVVNLIWW